MKLIVIGSNSSGNAYVLVSEKEKLLIECGVHISKIKKALNFDLSNLSAIVTHSHGDHAGSLQQLIFCGVDVYASKETFEAKDVISHHRAKVIEANKSFFIGRFRIKPFEVNHDVKCFGFLIYHPECGMTLFLTDTYYCDYTFNGLNNIIVEANHEVELMQQAGTEKFLRDRIMESHMNLQTCKELLLANDLSQVNNIVLIHLSDMHSDARTFRQEVRDLTGKNVWIAEQGLVIENFNKTPF